MQEEKRADRELVAKALLRSAGNVAVKCCFEGCGAMGIPAAGRTFFACDDCLDNLEAEVIRLRMFEEVLDELESAAARGPRVN